MDKQYIIMIVGIFFIGLCISIYAIYYKVKINKNVDFGRTKLDIYLLNFAKKMSSNKSIWFILDEQIDPFFVKNIKKNATAFLIVPKKCFIFKTYAIFGPQDQIVIEEENKFIERLCKKLDMNKNDFQFIKYYNDKLYLKNNLISMSSYKSLLAQINQYLQTEELDFIKIEKLKKINLNKNF